jgi:hypothetical protein
VESGRGSAVKDISIEDQLCSFVKEFSDDLCCLELLLFFSRHPNAKFNRTAVIHAVATRKFDAGNALRHLIDKKIVVTSCENGLTLYSLTKEEPAHSLAAQMVSIDQHQWQRVLEHILDANLYL